MAALVVVELRNIPESRCCCGGVNCCCDCGCGGGGGGAKRPVGEINTGGGGDTARFEAVFELRHFEYKLELENCRDDGVLHTELLFFLSRLL